MMFFVKKPNDISPLNVSESLQSVNLNTFINKSTWSHG
jgi:hypothetical protein